MNNPFSGLQAHIQKMSKDKILAFLSSDKIGKKVNRDDVEIIDPTQYAALDPNESFYYYDGPLDDKTRDFCQAMLLQGKFYSQFEIDRLSSILGYDVDLYCGSFNCRHQWKRARIKTAIQDGTLDKGLIANGNDARSVARHQPEDLRG